MIDLELYGEIRRLKADGVSQRKIAEKLGVARDTVAKYCDGGHIPGVPTPRMSNTPASKAALMATIRKYCENHINGETRKHKINAKTLWRDLHHQYPLSKATFRRYWAEIKGERQAETRLPLTFKIAEAAQVDWKVAKARIRGTEVSLHILCVTSMYSYAPFMKAYINEKQHNLIDGLVSAMDFIRGPWASFYWTT